METVAIFEAKSRLSEILAAVENGEEFTVTKRGEPIARIVPYRQVPNDDAAARSRALIARIRAARDAATVEEFDLREAIEDGPRLMPFVVDNSVVVGWHFSGQTTPCTEAILDALDLDTAHVPALWALEFSNVIRKALAGKKITDERAREIMQAQAGLRIVVPSDVADPAENMALALRYGLSSYDAAYLDLALRLRLPIAAKDGPLCDAARPAGVGLQAGNSQETIPGPS